MIYDITYSASVRFNPVSVGYWCNSRGKLASPFATGAVSVKRILDYDKHRRRQIAQGGRFGRTR